MIGFGDAVKMYFARYVDFQGRSSRAEYWWPALFNFIIGAVFAILAIVTGGGVDAYMSNSLNTIGWVFYGVSALYGLATIIPNIAVAVRRFHDRDMSGWWILAFIAGFLIPLVNLLVIIGYIVLMCLPGTKGPNKFGQDPYGGMDVDAFD